MTPTNKDQFIESLDELIVTIASRKKPQKKPRKKPPTLETYAQQIRPYLEKYNITLTELRRKQSNDKRIMLAKRAIIGDLRDVEHYTYSEIASILDCTTYTITDIYFKYHRKPKLHQGSTSVDE